MAVTDFYQLADYSEENSVEGDSAAPKWRVVAGYDEDEVRTYLKANLPATKNNLLLRTISVKYIGAGPGGVGYWDATTKYAQLEKSISWDTTGGQQKITQSLATKESHGVDPNTGATLTTIPDFAGAIGVTKDGVEGCEIYAPAEKFSLTVKHQWADLPPGYLQQLKDLKQAPVNDAPFSLSIKGQELDYEAGEVLFLGTTAGQRANDDIDITYHFLAGIMRLNLPVGGWKDLATGTTKGQMLVNKSGWDFLWVRYAEVEQQNSSSTTVATIKRAIGAYVERVYDSGDFSFLILG